MADTYNGWPNYETWSVYCWLTNEYAAYHACCRIAQRATSAEQTSDALKVQWTTRLDEARVPFPFKDLLTTAVERVNWDAIGRAFYDAEHEKGE